MAQRCQETKTNGDACRMRPIRDEAFCFAHHPAHAEDAARARQLGGHRRRRDGITAGAYDLGSLETIDEIRRVIEIGIFDTLGLENSVARSRALFWGCRVLIELRNASGVEERLRALEAVLRPRNKPRGTK